MGVFYVLFLLSLGSLLFRGEVGGCAWLSFLLAWIALSAFLHEVLNADIRVVWISLNSARTAFAVFTGLIEFKGFVVGGMLPSLFMFGGKFLIRFPSGSGGELVFFCALGFIGVAVIVLPKVWTSFFRGNAQMAEMENRLIAEFRSIAAELVPEKSDPQFKGWDGIKRLSENRPIRWWR